MSTIDGPVRWAGFVPRTTLLQEYASASVLALPLFDDVQSQSRFPTKLGEYLASGRPVVTNRIGEIPQFLTDGVNAYLPEPGDVATFGQAIMRLLEDPSTGQALGSAGRQVAEHHFHYANYGPALCEFFSSLKQGV
jgi:glycosyltransferase involved in cell wall biosynthesis